MDGMKTAKRMYLMKFDSNPHQARQQVTAVNRAAALRQLVDSLSDAELMALVSITMESETEPERPGK